jgi:hypothetical protein
MDGAQPFALGHTGSSPHETDDALRQMALFQGKSNGTAQ